MAPSTTLDGRLVEGARRRSSVLGWSLGVALVCVVVVGCSPIADGRTSTNGASSPSTATSGAVTHGALVSGGRDRTYRLYVPSDLPAAPVPLFIGLHGGGGWGDQLASTDHIEGLAESKGFIVAHPDGVKLAVGPGGVWNGGVCCGVAARRRVDDVGFIDALIEVIASDHRIDPNRVFAFGHSNGGIMSYRLACDLAERVVGIGVVAGTLGVEGCDPSHRVSVIHLHGTADENIPIGGGAGSDSVAGVSFPSPRDGFDTLAAENGCPRGEEQIEGDISTERRQPCEGGAAAVFVTIEGAGHGWPGGTDRIDGLFRDAHPSYDATSALVAFLLSHPRR